MALVQHPLFAGLPEGPLVSTAWLAEQLGADELVVLDATVLTVDGFGGGRAFVSGEEQYLVHGHIPGAVFADLFDDFSDPEGEYAFTRPSTIQFEREAQKHGIDNDAAVVIYDTTNGIWAARLWWLFRSFGFEARVLDGGLTAWRSEGRRLQTGDVRPRRAGEFSAAPRTQAWASKREVEAVVAGDTDAVLVCAVPEPEFLGAAANRPRRGHIPASVNVPAAALTAPDSGRYLPADQLREMFADVIEAADPVIAYCGSGIASASDALALTLLGRTDVRLYDGSLNEWSADPSAPLETGDSLLAASGAPRHQHSAARH